MLTCVCWVKQGIAKEVPDKVSLEEEDLKALLEKSEEKLRDVTGEDINISEIMGEDPTAGKDDAGDEEKEESMNDEIGNDPDDEEIINHYGLQDYDEEGALMTGAGMAGLMYYASGEDPYVNLRAVDEDDREDDNIKKDDNLIIIGKLEEDCSCLEVYVYNESEESLYVHHDILLESFPLCLEWLSFDPGSAGKSGNFVAVGMMEPDIEVWDLDIVNTIEPVYTLKGEKKKKKLKRSTYSGKLSGHKDSVLCLTWNSNSVNVLASGSVDTTLLLWDLNQGCPVYQLTHHSDKVQAAKWHPLEAQTLLTGSFDKTVAVLDCRTPNDFKSWKLTGECEQVIWDHFSPYNFMVSGDDGVVTYYDVRNESSIFTLHAHDEATTGMSLSSQQQHCLTTVSSDKQLKVWDYHDKQPVCIMARDMKMGNLNFIKGCPDFGHVFAVGGEKEGLRIFNIEETSQGKQYLSKSKSQKTTEATSQNITASEPMNTDSAANAMLALTLKNESSKEETTIIKRRKKKKNKKN